MTGHEVTFFREVPLKVGQKINFVDGKRRGDWLVVEITDRKIRLRCPVSGRELESDRILCHAETKVVREWPAE